MARVTPHQLDLWSAEMSDIYQALEIDIIKMVIKRFKLRGKPDIFEWQAEIMSELHLLNSHVYHQIAKATGITEKDITRAIKEVGYSSVKDTDKYLANHMPPQPIPSDLDNILRAYSDQTFITIKNKINQTLVSTQYGFGPIAEGYQEVLNKTVAGFASGMYTHKQALEKAILEWADKGVANVFIDKGGNTWSLERYVDTVLKSTLNRTYNELRTSRMEDYDIHTVVMSTVYDSAARCAYCQGKVLDMRPVGENDSGYPSIYLYGYGTAGGTLGINCRHAIYPHIPGVNIERESDIDPNEAIERSKVREQQRQLERTIRKTKKNIIITKELNSSPAVQAVYKEQLRAQQAAVRKLLDVAPWLRRQYGREKVITPTETLMKGSL